MYYPFGKGGNILSLADVGVESSHGGYVIDCGVDLTILGLHT